MSIICKKCGRQLADSAKFCGGCGARIGEAVSAVTPGVCPNCGSPIPEGVHFCTVCGTSIAGSPAEQAAEEDVTMDELVPPVITDDLFDEPKSNIPVQNTAETTVEAVTGVYTDPIFDHAHNAPAPEAPAPEPAVIVQPVIETPPVPEVKLPKTPVINDTYYQQPAPAPAPAPAPVRQPTYQQPQQNFQQTQQQFRQNFQQPQGYQQPNPVPNGYNNPQQPMYQPYPDPRTVQTKQGGSGILVPIILIILILGVIAFDVFFLFRDRIFGSDDDDSSKKSSISRSADDDEEEEEDDED